MMPRSRSTVDREGPPVASCSVRRQSRPRRTPTCSAICAKSSASSTGFWRLGSRERSGRETCRSLRTSTQLVDSRRPSFTVWRSGLAPANRERGCTLWRKARSECSRGSARSAPSASICVLIICVANLRRQGMSQPISVVVPVYDGVTQLDFTGPHQFLSRTPDLHVRVASLGGEPVTADRLTFSNLDDLAAIESCDVLLVPGGGGCLAAIENDLFVKEIARLGATAR